MPEWGTIASVLLALGALITAIFSRIKLNAEADVSIAKQAMEMVKEVRLDVERLKLENAQLYLANGKLRDDLETLRVKMMLREKQIEKLLAGVQILCAQVTASGQVPMFRPDMAANAAEAVQDAGHL